MDPARAISPPVELAQKSDPGRDPAKQINEDSCGYQETRLGHLCVVCDGMGGHEGGREASSLALSTILEHITNAPEGAAPSAELGEAVAEANRRVYTMSSSAPANARPGSTVVAVLMHAAGTEVAHVGDSRCYLVHYDQIFQLTKDHSMVQQLVDAGLLTPAQAAVHPNANQITRALGMAPEAEVELKAQPVVHVTGDAFVLCSDGLSDLVEAPEILQIVGSAPAAQAAGKLVDLANARGGHDNISVMILRARASATAASTRVMPTVAEMADTISDEEELPSQRVTLPGDVPSAVRGKTQPSAEAEEPLGAQEARDATSRSMIPVHRKRGLGAAKTAGIVVVAIGLFVAVVVLYVELHERHESRAPTATVSSRGGSPSAPSSSARDAADAAIDR